MPGKRWARRDACRAGRLRAASEERLGCTPSLKQELPVPIPWRGFVSGRRAAEGRHPCWQGLGQRSVGHAPELKNACAAGRDIAPRCVKLAGGARVDPARPPSPAPAHPRLLPSSSRASGYPLSALSGMRTPPGRLRPFALHVALLCASALRLCRPAGNGKRQGVQACRWWRRWWRRWQLRACARW